MCCSSRDPNINIDYPEIKNATVQSIQGKGFLDALKFFVSLKGYANFQELRDYAITELDKGRLSDIFSSAIINKTGQTIARYDGINFNHDKYSNESIIKKMIEKYLMDINLYTVNKILPALEIIVEEHPSIKDFCFDLTGQCHLIPLGHRIAFGMGLYAGFKKDLITATHILSPQFENLIRNILKDSGAQTSILDNELTEDETSLNTLIKNENMLKIFGEDFTFEIEALLCQKPGPNLRNITAHGILDDADGFSPHTIYLWWLIFKFIFTNYYKVYFIDAKK